MGTPTLNVKAEAALARATNFINAFPKPGPDQGVKANYVLRALELLSPLAQCVVALPVGTKKGTIAGDTVATALRAAFPLFVAVEAVEGAARPGTGYLSGSSVITADDHGVAQSLLDLIKNTLPPFGDRPLDRGQYNLVKEQAHRLLAIGTDLDVDTTPADQVALFWAAVKEAVVDLKNAVDQGISLGKALVIIAAIAGGAVVANKLIGD